MAGEKATPISARKTHAQTQDAHSQQLQVVNALNVRASLGEDVAQRLVVERERLTITAARVANSEHAARAEALAEAQTAWTAERDQLVAAEQSAIEEHRAALTNAGEALGAVLDTLARLNSARLIMNHQGGYPSGPHGETVHQRRAVLPQLDPAAVLAAITAQQLQRSGVRSAAVDEAALTASGLPIVRSTPEDQQP